MKQIIVYLETVGVRQNERGKLSGSGRNSRTIIRSSNSVREQYVLARPFFYERETERERGDWRTLVAAR